MKKAWNQLWILALVLGAGCGGGDGRLEVRKEALTEIPAGQNDTAMLGQAFEGKKMKLRNMACLAGTTQKRNIGDGTKIEYKRDMNYEEALNSITGSLGVGVSFPAVSVGAEAHVAIQAASSNLSETHTIFWVANSVKEYLVPGSLHLTDLGQYIVTEKKGEIEPLCGDGFVSEMLLGASIVAILRVDFLNEEDKLQLGGKIKVSVAAGLAQGEGSLEYLDTNLKQRAQVSLTVHQVGGKPNHLLSVVDQDIISCTLAHPDPCFNTLRNVIQYMKDDFRAQLEDSQAWVPIKFTIQRYDDSGVFSLVPPAGYQELDEILALRRVQFDRRYREEIMNAERAQRLLRTAKTYLTARQTLSISEIEDQALSNAEIWARLTLYCYDHADLAACEAKKKQLEVELVDYDPSALTVDVDDAKCEEARSWALGHGYVNQTQYDRYAARNWAPIFFDKNDRGKGIQAWAECQVAASEL